MYCTDILKALTKDFFSRKGNKVEEPLEMDPTATLDRPGYSVVSSTLWRQREDYCARLIQLAWRKHKHLRAISECGGDSNELEDKLTTSVQMDDGTDGTHKVILHPSRSPSITSHMTDV